MGVQLNAREMAGLTGKTERTIRNWAASGKFPSEIILNQTNRPEYLFPLEELPAAIQQRYYEQLRAHSPIPAAAPTPRKAAKPLDHRGGRALRAVVQAGIPGADHFRRYFTPPLERGAEG